MPKMKSHKGAQKRFKKTSKGKYKHKKSKRNHLMTKKNNEKKQQLRNDDTAKKCDEQNLDTLLPYE
ncbi:MAG: 50S ribosomal protein L35 [Bacillota bacterium]